jgi:RHS repeat-associated protein
VTAGTSTETIRELAFLPFGPRLRAELPPFDGTTGHNAVVSNREYDLRGQVSEIDVTAPTGSVLDRTYSYDVTSGSPGPVDPGPNLDRVIDHRDAGESRFYAYDELDRLWKSTDLSGSPHFEYVYDAAGNRTSLVTAAGTTMTSYEPGSDRIAQQTGAFPRHYAHDAFGNRIYAGSTLYAGSKSHVFDESNRLVELRDPVTSTSLATYAYDAFGRRVKKNVSGQTTLFFYDTEGHTIEQLAVNPTGDDTAEDFVWVEDEPMGLVHWTKEVGSGAGGGSGPPAFYWIHGDHLRTPLAMTDTPATPSTAKTVWRASHEPFGLATVQTDPDGDSVHVALDLRFPGQVYDAESGLHQNFYRDYDPATGRYVEADPIGQAAGSNLYGYVYANPIEWMDPLGLDLWICDRSTHGPMPGNHAYAWDPDTGENEGRGGNSSGGGEGASQEDPRGNGDACRQVPETRGKEEEILDDLNRTANRGPWIPFFNDCHNSLDRSLERHGVPPLPSPNGRLGRSNPGSPKP